jgi:methylenetetrahydrofolate reductase (NADPH)
MRVANLYEKSEKHPVLSFEFSRPKNEVAHANLDKALDSLTSLSPTYVSVTFGAGGSTREGSYDLIDKLKNERGFNVVAYIAGIGLGPEKIIEALEKFKSLGVETVFVVRGDAPTWEENYQPHPEAMDYASDLLKFIKSHYDFCLGAAGYPETHLEALSPEKDLEYLKLKVDEGAEYIVSQYSYDNQYFYDYLDRVLALGITVPVVPGIMPIYTVKMTENLARICGATITEKVRNGLDVLPPDDKEAVLQYGIDLATEQCKDLLRHGVPGLHFYTMNRARSIKHIMANLQRDGFTFLAPAN